MLDNDNPPNKICGKKKKKLKRFINLTMQVQDVDKLKQAQGVVGSSMPLKTKSSRLG